MDRNVLLMFSAMCNEACKATILSTCTHLLHWNRNVLLAVLEVNTDAGTHCFSVVEIQLKEENREDDQLHMCQQKEKKMKYHQHLSAEQEVQLLR